MPEELSSIRSDGWEEFDFIVDSGASETVIGPQMINSAETKASRGSKSGVRYEVANGVRIDNLGRRNSWPQVTKELAERSPHRFVR